MFPVSADRAADKRCGEGGGRDREATMHFANAEGKNSDLWNTLSIHLSSLLYKAYFHHSLSSLCSKRSTDRAEDSSPQLKGSIVDNVGPPLWSGLKYIQLTVITLVIP